jgi:hypothetical protein
MRIYLSSYELSLWLKPAPKPACRRTWLMAEACTAKPSSGNIRRHAPTIVLYHYPQPYAVVQSHCEVAHSVRLVELYISLSECLLLALCICYSCLHYLPYYGRPLELPAAPACAGFIITLPERPASRICFSHLPPVPAACHAQYYYYYHYY